MHDTRPRGGADGGGWGGSGGGSGGGGGEHGANVGTGSLAYAVRARHVHVNGVGSKQPCVTYRWCPSWSIAHPFNSELASARWSTKSRAPPLPVCIAVIVPAVVVTLADAVKTPFAAAYPAPPTE